MKGGMLLLGFRTEEAGKGIEKWQNWENVHPLLQASFDYPSASMCKSTWKRKMQSVMLKWELVELKSAANFLPGKGTVTMPGPSLQGGCARTLTTSSWDPQFGWLVPPPCASSVWAAGDRDRWKCEA